MIAKAPRHQRLESCKHFTARKLVNDWVAGLGIEQLPSTLQEPGAVVEHVKVLWRQGLPDEAFIAAKRALEGSRTKETTSSRTPVKVKAGAVANTG